MKVFRDLTIRGTPANVEAVLNRIDERIRGDWHRDEPLEEPLGRAVGGEYRCYVRAARDPRPEACLWLYRDAPREVRVVNVVPVQVGQLSIEEYNSIVEEFHQLFVVPASEQCQVVVTLSEDDVGIGKWVTPRTAKLLQVFSAAANKSTGASHPLDEQRWYAFIVSAHREGAQLSAGSLRQWLEEEAHWPEDVAANLAGDYEQARSLLKYYDESP